MGDMAPGYKMRQIVQTFPTGSQTAINIVPAITNVDAKHEAISIDNPT